LIDDDIVIYLIGNKVDLYKNRKVTKEEAIQYSKYRHFNGFGECTSLKNINIKRTFTSFYKTLYKKNKNKLIEKTVQKLIVLKDKVTKTLRYEFELSALFRKEDSICHIISSKNKERIGFFIELDIKDIPFNKCLLTNNHALNTEEIRFNNDITIEFKNNIKKQIIFPENRRVFTDENLDYTCIEIFPDDNIQHFFQIDHRMLEDGINKIKGEDIILLSFDKKLTFPLGKVFQIIDNKLIYIDSSKSEISDSLIINKSNFSVIGLNLNGQKANKYYLATSINSIIDDIKKKSIIFKSENYKERYKELELIGYGNFGTVIYKGKLIEKNNILDIFNIFNLIKLNQNEEDINYRALKIINKDEMRTALKNDNNTDNIEEEFKSIVINSIKNEIINMKICMTNNINSVKFYELYDNGKEYAIVMELCDDNLQNFLNRKNCGFNKDEIHAILNQLNNTFKIMFKNNIIHRDLKLPNILIKYENIEKSKFIVKLADYGISRKLLSLSKKCKTISGTIFTTSPEILAGEEYDNKCDLWSLGVIIYQLFFKKYPYNASTEIGIFNQICHFGQTLLQKTGDKKLDDLIRKLLVKEPEKRINWKDYFNHPFFKKEK